jgi:MFS family permease
MTQQKFYGWKLVGVLFLLYLAASITLYGGNIANTFMAKTTGMSRTIFGAGFATAYLLVGLSSALAAVLVGKRGERFTLSLGMGAITLGSLIMAIAGQRPVFYIISFGLIIGTGFAFATVLPIQSIITRWFVKKRALATALVLTAGGFGGILAAPLINKLIESTGGKWQLAYFVMAAVSGIVTVIAALLVRNNPRDLDQLPDGDSIETEQNPAQAKKQTRVYQTNAVWTLKEAIRTAPLWLLLAAASGQFIAFYLCIGHSVLHLTDMGIDEASAALSLGILAFASIGGRLLSGVLGDRIEPRFVIMGGLAMTIVGCLLITNPSSPLMIYSYAIFVGTGFGLVYVCLFAMLGNYYGAANIQNFLGFLIPIVTLFGAGAPFVGGMIKDQLGSYNLAFIGTAIIAAIAALLQLLARPPQKNGL